MVRSQRVGYQYELQTREERIGDQEFRIDCLKSLDETIDGLFELLSRTGEEALLEDLCPYFGTIWPSARALAEELENEILQGKTVLELGCGLALPSLMAARKGAKVVATDSHPDIATFLDRNLALNALSVDFRKLDWTDRELGLGEFDWVVASDVLYEKHQPAIVASAIHRHLKRRGRAILTDPGRPYLQAFTDEIRTYGMKPALTTRRVFDPPGTKEIFVLRFD